MKSKYIFFLGILIILSKLFFIEVDPPKWNTSFYQPIDELYYVYPAYNYFDKGELFVEDDAVLFGNPIFTNVLTYVSLYTFGNNYFGLRMSSIVFGILSFIILFSLLKKLRIQEYLLLIVVLFFTFNFNFTVSNLVLEPSIARMASMMFALWLIVKWKEKDYPNDYQIIWQSCTISLLLILSYPTNAFIVLAGYITLVLIKNSNDNKITFEKRIPKILNKSIYFFIGGLISIIFYIGFAKLIGVNVIEDTFMRGSAYNNRVGLGIREIFDNILNLTRSNFFRFNPLLLYLTIFSIGTIIFNNNVKKNNTILFSTVFFVCFLLQSAFINDFPQRKLIAILPLILLITTFGFQKFYIELQPLNKKKYLIYLISFLFLLPLFYLERDFYYSEALPLITFFIGVIFFLLMIKKRENKIWAYLLFSLLLIPEFLYTTKHYIIQRPQHYKEALMQLSEYNNYNLLGGLSMGFQLYNDADAYLNMYLYYGDIDSFWRKTENLSKNDQKDYAVGYRDQEEKFRKIGFKPLKVLMLAEKTVYSKDLIIYEEICP